MVLRAAIDFIQIQILDGPVALLLVVVPDLTIGSSVLLARFGLLARLLALVRLLLDNELLARIDVHARIYYILVLLVFHFFL